MTHRDKERAKSLEYARSQGWLPPEIGGHGFAGSRKDLTLRIADLELRLAEYDREMLGIDKPRVIADADLTTLRAAGERCADLEIALATERESHAITKRAVTRGTRARCAALEGALRELLTAVDVDSSPTLDGELVERVRGVLS